MAPLRKTIEILLAIYCGGFAAYVQMYAAAGSNALAWANFDTGGAVLFSWGCMIAATIHTFGLWLNGGWRWSPVIRVTGILLYAALFTCLAWIGSIAANTAGYSYMWLSAGIMEALRTALLRDTYIAIKGVRFGHSYS